MQIKETIRRRSIFIVIVILVFCMFSFNILTKGIEETVQFCMNDNLDNRNNIEKDKTQTIPILYLDKNQFLKSKESGKIFRSGKGYLDEIWLEKIQIVNTVSNQKENVKLYNVVTLKYKKDFYISSINGIKGNNKKICNIKDKIFLEKENQNIKNRISKIPVLACMDTKNLLANIVYRNINIDSIYLGQTSIQFIQRNSFFIILIILILGGVIVLSIRQGERHYQRMVMYDSLTKLWSRNKFDIEAEGILNKNKQKSYMLVSIDIDKFKNINDFYGYQVGNDILKAVAQAIKNSFIEEGIYARNVADQFLILVEKTENNGILRKLVELPKIVGDYNKSSNCQMHIPIKIGICVIESRNNKVMISNYIDKANIAKNTIKGIHNRFIANYDDELEENVKVEAEIENAMEMALRNKEFVVYYQPKYNANTEEVIGAEALVRWMKPGVGMIPPYRFIPLFEKNGFIVHLDFYVYEEVVQLLRRWMDEGREVVPIAINVSRVHIGTTGFVDNLIQLIEKYNVPSSLIEVELTEGAFGEKNDSVLQLLVRLKELGFVIAIDDFGTGYSSLNLLKEMPVDILKIDKGFLEESKNSEKSKIIIEQVIQMAKRIHVSTICEGVETKEQADFLRNIGCDMIQGYLYAKPMSERDFVEEITKNHKKIY